MLEFLVFLGASLAILIVFTTVYVAVTPYNDFKLIKEGNSAAAVSLSSAIFGFTIVLASTVYFTHSLKEMVLWSCITMLVQLLAFFAVRISVAKDIEKGNMAQAVFTGSIAIAVGILNAVAISY